MAVGDGPTRRYCLTEEYRQAGVCLGVGDALALEFGRQLLGFLGGTDFSRWMTGLQERLGPALSPAAADQAATLSRRILYLSEPSRRYEAQDDVIDEILFTLLRERELRVEHEGSGGRRTYDHLQPLGLVMYRRALYLVVREPEAGTVLRLAVDRISDARRLPASFTYPEGFDLAAELGRGFGIFQEGEPERVVLRFVPRVARLVRSRVWHSTQELEDLPDGGVELHMTTCGRELVRLVLEFGETVEVVAPVALRDQVARELRNALAYYAPPPDAEGQHHACTNASRGAPPGEGSER